MIDTIFLALFIIEIALKWYVGFVSFFKSGWNLFDLFIVSSAIIAPGRSASDSICFYRRLAITFISSSRVLRILRILRAFRALRGVSFLEGLRSVAKTILESIPGPITCFSHHHLGVRYVEHCCFAFALDVYLCCVGRNAVSVSSTRRFWRSLLW